jgi:hypothetical protein
VASRVHALTARLELLGTTSLEWAASFVRRNVIASWESLFSMNDEHVMNQSWKDCIYQQREELARMLREPLELLAERLAPAWGDCDALDAVLGENFSSIPHCSVLYCVGMDGIQICDNVGPTGIVPG